MCTVTSEYHNGVAILENVTVYPKLGEGNSFFGGLRQENAVKRCKFSLPGTCRWRARVNETIWCRVRRHNQQPQQKQHKHNNQETCKYKNMFPF